MKKFVFNFILCILLFASELSFSQEQSKNTPSPPGANSSEQQAIKKLYEQASTAQDNNDLARALMYYHQIVQASPQDTSAATAKTAINTIMNSLQPVLLPDAALKKITREMASFNTHYLCYESIKLLINSFPPKKVFMDAKKVARECLADLIVRCRISYVAPPLTGLLYKGIVTVNGKPLHEFVYGNKTFQISLNENILYYRLTAYDAKTGKVLLTPLKELPYRLLQNDTKVTFRAFSADLTHLNFSRTFKAYFYFDTIETFTGAHISGLAREENEQQTVLDFPVKTTVKTILIDKKDLVRQTTFSERQIPSLMYKMPVASGSEDIAAASLARLKFYVDSRDYLQAAAFYLSLEDKDFFAQNKQKFEPFFRTIYEKITSAPLSERMLERGIYLLNNEYLFSGWNELMSIISTFPGITASGKAHNKLVDTALLPETTFYLSSLSSMPFPITFMGYNRVTDKEELFQINYRNRSYFVERNGSQGGFIIKQSTEKTIEIPNPQLNAVEKKLLRWIIVEFEHKEPVELGPNEQFVDTEKSYVELEDSWSGKSYPGYVVLDSITIKDGTTLSGIIDDSQEKTGYVFYPDFTMENTRVIKPAEVKTVKVHSTYVIQNMQMLEKFLGKITFSELKKYFNLKKISEQQLAQQELAAQQLAAQQVEKTKKSVEAPKPQPAPVVERSVKKDELKIREEKVQLKKKIIRIMGVGVILWLAYMAYKLMRSAR